VLASGGVEPLDALGNPELRSTLALARRSQAPPTADDVSRELEIPLSVARWRLERLAAAGLLVPGYARRTGRTGPGAGRPAKTYAVASEGTSVEFPPRRYAQLLQLLVGALPSRGRRRRLADVGETFGRQLARAAKLRKGKDFQAGVRRVCDALGGLGFQATLEAAGPDRAVVVTPMCPLRPLVVQEREARAIDEAMWSGLVAEALTGAAPVQVRCETAGCSSEGSPCRVSIRLRPATQARRRTAKVARR
jgi:predicted ArsR family transcriptional regulator